MPFLSRIGVLAVLGVPLFFIPFWFEASPPLVDDGARLLSAAETQRIERYHERLLRDYDIDYRVVTASGLDDIDDFAVERFRSLDIGRSSRGGRGLLLVVDRDRDLVRLEVGYRLEGLFPDGFVGLIEREQMVPFFRQKRLADGILATTELIVSRAQLMQDHADGAPGTGGGGALSKAHFGVAAPVPDPATESADVAAGATPVETVAAYLDAMERFDDRPDLDIYTQATQRMLRRWVVTRAQMRNVAKERHLCSGARAMLDGDRAVVRFETDPGSCNPYFLRREAGVWRLDFVTMQKRVRFDHHNHWHMPKGAGEYAFAFN